MSICPGNWHFSPCPSIYRQVAEGYATTFSLVELIEKTNRPHRRERTFPIIYTVYSILNGTSSPQEGVKCVLRAVGGLNCVSYGMDCSLTLAYIQSRIELRLIWNGLVADPCLYTINHAGGS